MDILISGIGIAGPTVAYWLLRADPSHRITLVERDVRLRASGQSIDIRQAAVDILRQMNLIEAVRSKTTTEAGLRFIDANGNVLAEFPTSGDEANQGFTSEYEIMRGDLVDILYDAVKDRVETVFGEKVDSFAENEETGKVDVAFSNGRTKKAYDVVIAADGQSSRIRNIALGTTSNPREHFRPFCNYAAYFTMPNIPSLGDSTMASWYNATGGRVFFIRPDPRPGFCRANIVRQLLPTDVKENKRYRDGLAECMDSYRQLLFEDFADAGWEAKAILAGLRQTDDLYASETAQVQAPTAAVGRVAFLGDAGYCPSPLTGMGTSLAIIGAYILAGELSKVDTTGVIGALAEYNDTILPFARSVQNIPTSLPQYANPQSAWGLKLVQTMLRVVSWTKVYKLGSYLGLGPAFSKSDFQLPVYPWRTSEAEESVSVGAS